MDQNNNIRYTSSLVNDCFNELYSLTRLLFKQGCQSIYETVCEKSSDHNNMLFREFQEELQKVPSWNSVMIEKEYERFVLSSGCEWLGKLIVANFKAAAKNVLSSIQSSETQDNSIDLEVPTPQNFIHYCYIEIARQIWKKPQLFYHKFSAFEKQQNDESIDKIIENSIKTTINKQLPFDTLLKQSEESNKTVITPPPINMSSDKDQCVDVSQKEDDSSTLYLPAKPITTIPSTATSEQHSPSYSVEPFVKPVVHNLEKQPSTESFVSFDSNTNLNQVRTPSPAFSSTSLHKSASFIAPRRDSLDESDEEEDDDSVSNISDDSCSEEDDSFQKKAAETPTPVPVPVPVPAPSPTTQVSVPTHSQEEVLSETPKQLPEQEHQPLQQKEITETIDFVKDFQQKLITHDNNVPSQQPPQQPQQPQQPQEVTNPTIMTKHEEGDNVVVPVENNNNDEQFHIDLNKSIKEIYINDKKRKNEKKIKKILGVKMNYDTYIQQDKRKLRNYLILNQQSIPKA